MSFSYAQVLAAAGVGDPREIDGLLASGDPNKIRSMASGFARAGDAARTATAAAARADQLTAQSYRVDGAGVHDAPAATSATRAALGDGGEHHAQAASTLNGTADALESAAGSSAGHLKAMNESLAGVAGAMDRLSASAPSMLAADVATAQQSLFDQAVAAVQQHGSAIAELASSYDDVLRRTGAVLAEHGPPPGDDSYGAPPAPPPPPPESSLLDEAGDFLGDVADRIGAFGEAALHNPAAVASAVIGAGLIAVSTAGGAASVGLDLTGVGALIGVPAGALSVAGITTGTAILGTAMASINAEAGGSGSKSSVGQTGSDPAPAVQPTEPAAVRPQTESPRLSNIIDHLYKGTTNSQRVGDGTTADAVRAERATGQDTHGINHAEKARQMVNGLRNWLRRNPTASASDREVAQSELDNLLDALGK